MRTKQRPSETWAVRYVTPFNVIRVDEFPAVKTASAAKKELARMKRHFPSAILGIVDDATGRFRRVDP